MKRFLILFFGILISCNMAYAVQFQRWQFFPVSVYIEQHPKKPIVEKAFSMWQSNTGIAKFIYFRSEKQIPNITVKFSDNNTNEKAVGVARSYLPSGYFATSKITIWLKKPGNLSLMNDDELLNVALHEIGHALGLDHSPDVNDIMYSIVTGRTTLSPNDIAVFKKKYSIK